MALLDKAQPQPPAIFLNLARVMGKNDPGIRIDGITQGIEKLLKVTKTKVVKW